MTNYYKPLPDFITIKQSPIEGLGLFATSNITEGTVLGISHYIINGEYKRSPLGGFYNHSETPNIKRVDDEDAAYLVALRNIEAGEELVGRYTLYDPTK